MTKQLLVSINRDDCTWTYSTHGGNGGQNANKNATAVTVKHPPSGAIGHAADSKSQWQNRRAAWKRMAETSEFKAWIKREASRVSVDKAEQERRIEAEVQRMMRPESLRVEIGDGDNWTIVGQ